MYYVHTMYVKFNKQMIMYNILCKEGREEKSPPVSLLLGINNENQKEETYEAA